MYIYIYICTKSYKRAHCFQTGEYTDIPTIIDPSATINHPGATGSVIVGISVTSFSDDTNSPTLPATVPQGLVSLLCFVSQRHLQALSPQRFLILSLSFNQFWVSKPDFLLFVWTVSGQICLVIRVF